MTAESTVAADRALASRAVLIGVDGQPLGRTAVTVEQVRHEFGFGNIGFDFIEWLGGAPVNEGGRDI